MSTFITHTCYTVLVFIAYFSSFYEARIIASVLLLSHYNAIEFSFDCFLDCYYMSAKINNKKRYIIKK